MIPDLIQYGGQVMWLLLVAGAIAATVAIERFVTLHQAQIHTSEFLSGVKNVLKRGSVVEAISICEATTGPIPRLVKSAIANRDRGKERIREGLEETGLIETSRLERRLDILATIAQIAPLLGLLGATLGMIDVLHTMERQGFSTQFAQLSNGVWRALISSASGIGLAIPCHVAHNFLTARVDAILTDMEKAAMEILGFLTDNPNPSQKL